MQLRKEKRARGGKPAAEIRRRIDAGIQAAGGGSRLFFRADDIGVPSTGIERLMTLFARMRVPLSLAVVPAWLTGERWRRLLQAGRKSPELWCWHQHGWRHANHERSGKKQEFGPSRPPAKASQEVRRGRDRLQTLMGRHFYPVFTPPWNRCSAETLAELVNLNFRAVSRSRNSQPPAPRCLPEFSVHVDLHTRKEPKEEDARNAALGELQQGMGDSLCGVMLHHRRMNDRAFAFLELLLEILVQNSRIELVNFRDLLGHRQPE